jgi:hypothetical protein
MAAAAKMAWRKRQQPSLMSIMKEKRSLAQRKRNRERL